MVTLMASNRWCTTSPSSTPVALAKGTPLTVTQPSQQGWSHRVLGTTSFTHYNAELYPLGQLLISIELIAR